MSDDAIVVRIPAPKLRAASPRLLTQANVASVTGQSAGTFLASLAAFESAGGRVARHGKARFVDADAYIAWLFVDRDTKPDDSPDPAKDLADELGLEVSH